MRISEVGDVVTLKEWSGTIRLDGGSYLEWSPAYANFVNKVFRVDLINPDGYVRLALPDGSYLRWPVKYCAPPVKRRATPKRDTQSLAAADEALALALRYQKQLEDDLANERKTTAELRKQVADLTTLTTSLEKQVIDLRAEVQKVGKQRQSGSRFALLELD